MYWTFSNLSWVLMRRVKKRKIKLFLSKFLRKLRKVHNLNYIFGRILEWYVTCIFLYVCVSELDAIMKHIREQSWCNISHRAAWNSVWYTLIKELPVQQTPKKVHFFIFTHVLTLFRNFKHLYTRISILLKWCNCLNNLSNWCWFLRPRPSFIGCDIVW